MKPCKATVVEASGVWPADDTVRRRAQHRIEAALRLPTELAAV